MSRNGNPSLLLSPNSILANALLRSIDILRPRVLAHRPARIEFVVGTQINGAPHLGTNLVQTATTGRSSTRWPKPPTPTTW